MASMLTSLGSTANNDVTYMMMDFLSGKCTATSVRAGGGESGRKVNVGKERSEGQTYAAHRMERGSGEGWREEIRWRGARRLRQVCAQGQMCLLGSRKASCLYTLNMCSINRNNTLSKHSVLQTLRQRQQPAVCCPVSSSNRWQDMKVGSANVDYFSFVGECRH